MARRAPSASPSRSTPRPPTHCGARLSSMSAFALGLIGLVLFAGAWLQASVGLSPLRRLRDELALGPSRRQAAPRRSVSPPRLRRWSSDLNRLLDRQEQLVDKARERAGDLAHGFKTPLTILQGEARRLEGRRQFESAALVKQQVHLMRRHVDRELARARTVGATAAAGTLTDARRSIERLIDLVGRMPRGDAIVWDNQVDAALSAAHGPRRFWRSDGQSARQCAQVGEIATCESTANRRAGAAHRRRRRRPRRAGSHARRRGAARRSGERRRRESSGLGLAIVADVLAQYGSTLTIEDFAASAVAGRASPPRSDAARLEKRLARAPGDGVRRARRNHTGFVHAHDATTTKATAFPPARGATPISASTLAPLRRASAPAA